MPVLTEADRTLLPMAIRSQGQFHTACKWYLMGWDPLWYQYMFHQFTQPNITFLAGIAAGKTSGVAASYMIDCLTIPYFRALNTSVTAKQSELPFEMVQPWIEDNPHLSHLIEDTSLRPYPTIKFVNGSEWIFRTAGKDARYLRGTEFDRINYDEAGLDFSGETIKVLRGRLRGTRPDGTHRMGRMDIITSPTDAPWLRERFDKGWNKNPACDLSNYISMRITTYMNERLSKQQVQLMEAEYSDDMILVELAAEFPDYGASMFPRSHVAACTDQSLIDAVEEAFRGEASKKRGYNLEEHPRYGVTKFEMPYEPNGEYIMAGDPGTDSPPRRNAPCVAVLNIKKRPHKIAYFDWVDGRGSYMPFLNSYKYCIDKYHPFLKGVDVTGTQKAIDELAFENVGISVDGISFNRDKDAMLNSLSLAVSEHDMTWPNVKGIIRQFGSYSRENDKKVPQDIVMTFAMLAWLARFVPAQVDERTAPAIHANYRNRRARTVARTGLR
ncbi:MAG: terminase family protein [Anaerolineaceae bacterium]